MSLETLMVPMIGFVQKYQMMGESKRTAYQKYIIIYYSFCVGIQLDMFREMPQAGMCICWKTETSRCNVINRIYQIFVLLIALKFSPCQGCNGGVCYCDDRDACNQGSSFVPSFLPVALFSLLFAYLQ